MGLVVGYARVSTDKQALTHSLEHQKARLHDSGIDILHYDVESGGEPSRKGFDKVLALIKEKSVTKVVATKWDRITRNLQLYLEIQDAVKRYNVKLHFLDGGEADFDTPTGRLRSVIEVALAVHEREKIVERVNEGFDGRRKREVAWTRPPWGYIIVNEKYELDRRSFSIRLSSEEPNKNKGTSNALKTLDDITSSKVEIAREFFDYFLESRSIPALQQYSSKKYGLSTSREDIIPELKDFPISSRGLKQWLQNPVFQGHSAYLKHKKNGGVKAPGEWEIHLDTHPEHRLITAEEANEIKEILESNSKKFGHPAATFYLTGLVFCQTCGRSCSLKRGDDYAYYGCRYSSTICENRKSIRIELIEKAIISELVRAAIIISKNPLSQASTSEIIEVKQQIDGLESLSGAKFNLIIQDAIEKLKKREKKLLDEMSEVEQIAQRLLCHPAARKINFWYTLNQLERKIFYERLVSRVVILSGEVTSVKLKFDCAEP